MRWPQNGLVSLSPREIETGAVETDSRASELIKGIAAMEFLPMPFVRISLPEGQAQGVCSRYF
jgi:hypothetical protein